MRPVHHLGIYFDRIPGDRSDGARTLVGDTAGALQVAPAFLFVARLRTSHPDVA
jgi:hypothetical protein